MGKSDRNKWLIELSDADRKGRSLTAEDGVSGSFLEECVICNAKTNLWLQPENAPLCSAPCLAVYLTDPSVYDPRELHVRPSPRLVYQDDPPKKRKKRLARWEPTDADIKAAQERLAKVTK